MGWEDIASFGLSPNWQYTEPVEGELFRLIYPDQNSIARALICQCELQSDGTLDYYGIQRINANQREILLLQKPYCFGERRIAIKQIYGSYQWELILERFMPINNAVNVQQVTLTNSITTSTDARISLTAATSTLVLAANTNRKDVTITLETANVSVYIKRGATTGLTDTSGAMLLTGRGSSYSIGPEDLYTGQISAYCSAAAVLNVTEGV
jgi:hypothetical protein